MSSQKTESTYVDPQAVANTYKATNYSDGWAAVEEYRDVMAFASQHPDMGSHALSRYFEIPRGRVDAWKSGSKPDALRGVETADDRGWLAVSPRTDRFRGLNALVAWVFSGGSITTETWVPYFAVDNRQDENLLNRVADLVGVELDMTRSGGDGRAREFRPTQDGSVLGRVLHVLGAPAGPKNADRTVRLPVYLGEAPQQIRREFAQVYLHNRGQPKADSDVIALREQRSVSYLEELADFLAGVTGGAVRVSDKNVVLSVDAAREMAVWDPLLDVE